MIEIDAQEAEARFGPCWEDVLKVISQAEALTFDQIARAATFDTGGAAAWEAFAAGWAAAAFRASAAGRGDAWTAAQSAAWTAAWSAVRARAASIASGDADVAVRAAGDAAAAAVVSDLVGERGLTDKHIAALTQAWREIIGVA